MFSCKEMAFLVVTIDSRKLMKLIRILELIPTMTNTKIFRDASFLLILLCFCMGCPNTAAQLQKDTIKPGEAFNFSDQLVSANGLFRLGFFNLGDYNRYLAIWYTNPSSNYQVWIANREIPVIGGKGNLTLDMGGILKIMVEGGNQIALNSNDHASPNSSATLNDLGNFVLTELNIDGSAKQVLWQSFDYPTNVFLPGMKLGIDFRTGKKWSISSWLSSLVPASGAVSVQWNYTTDGTSTGQIVMRHRGEDYWSTGIFNHTDQSFKNIRWWKNTNLYDINNFNFTTVSNENESYITYSVVNGSFSRWMMSADDGFTSAGTEPGFGPIVPCNGFDTYPGCIVEKPPNCRNGSQIFVPQTISLSSGVSYIIPNSSLGLSDCWNQCWRNCSCIGYSTLYNNRTGCQFWSSGLNIVEGIIGSWTTIFALNSTLNGTSSTNNGRTSNSGRNWWIWMTVAFLAVFIFILLGFFCILRRKKLKAEEKERYQEEILLELERLDESEIGNAGKYEVKMFSFASILAATNSFSYETKLGQGGFGPVYKGQLSDGKEIAVKRLSRGSGQGLVEFKNEIILIAQLQHMNLVRLLGCCIYRDENMLIYEYMPNKSLDCFLFDTIKKKILDWEKRYIIIEGIAQGLLYLHRYSRLRIIHRDLKASNILLDEDMNPKISDFGMARIFGRNESEANTDRIVGTYGYMSPEYAMEGIFSEKSDVYSFGVLMLEIVSGRKNGSNFLDNRSPNLVGHAWEVWQEGTVLKLVDSTLEVSCPMPQVLRCIHIGLLCVQESAIVRPTISDVISMLANETMLLPPPEIPSNSTQKTLTDGHCSTYVSMSVVEAR